MPKQFRIKSDHYGRETCTFCGRKMRQAERYIEHQESTVEIEMGKEKMCGLCLIEFELCIKDGERMGLLV